MAYASNCHACNQYFVRDGRESTYPTDSTGHDTGTEEDVQTPLQLVPFVIHGDQVYTPCGSQHSSEDHQHLHTWHEPGLKDAQQEPTGH